MGYGREPGDADRYYREFGDEEDAERSAREAAEREEAEDSDGVPEPVDAGQTVRIRNVSMVEMVFGSEVA
jgi:hypothetical protein